MAKKSPPPARRPSPAGVQSRIARCDRDLVRLLEERAKLTQQAAKLTGEATTTSTSAGVNDDYLAKLLEGRGGALEPRALRSILAAVVSACDALVRPRRVAYLGPPYSYSHLAVLHHFGPSAQTAPVGTISAVFEEVERGQADFGIVPIENSTDGRIADTLENFTRVPLRIGAEVEMSIHHTLLGLCPRDEVKEVYSRPQALSQCRNWIARHLPGARTVEVTSTSTAAQLARDKPGAAAIASHEAGVHYGLNVLAERIEDNPGNTTRFAVISKQAAPRSGSDKTAILFQLEHRPGVLAEALAIFKRNRLNLNWIESFPMPNRSGHYLFFVEFEGHQLDLRARRALESLSKKSLRLEVLGSFPAGRPVD